MKTISLLKPRYFIKLSSLCADFNLNSRNDRLCNQVEVTCRAATVHQSNKLFLAHFPKCDELNTYMALKNSYCASSNKTKLLKSLTNTAII